MTEDYEARLRAIAQALAHDPVWQAAVLEFGMLIPHAGQEFANAACLEMANRLTAKLTAAGAVLTPEIANDIAAATGLKALEAYLANPTPDFVQ
jgi:hypothetical protein